MSRYTQKDFEQSDLNGKVDILMDLANRISYKFASHNSFRIDQDDISQELFCKAWDIMKDQDYNPKLGLCIKSMYNKAVDIYNSYKNLRSSELTTDTSGLEWFIMNYSGSNSDKSSDSKVDDEGFSSGNEYLIGKCSSRLGTSDTSELRLMVQELLNKLDDHPLERKYVLIKLKMDGILDDCGDLGIDCSCIKDIDFSKIEGEYDSVLALGHYTTPKSGGWYSRKSDLKEFILSYLLED